MFTELRSILASRSITITVVALGEDQIRVNVIPHSRPEDNKINEQIKYSHKDEVASISDAAIKALATPISLTGTAEEIDEKFSGVLLRFVESHACAVLLGGVRCAIASSSVRRSAGIPGLRSARPHGRLLF